MSSYSHVVILGNLTRDPELRYLPSGVAVCDISLATNDKWTDKKTGEKKEEVNFLEVTLFGKPAETSAEYLRKGRKALFSGRLKQERWETQDGQKRSKVKVMADNVVFIGTGEKHESRGDEAKADVDAQAEHGATGAEDVAL